MFEIFKKRKRSTSSASCRAYGDDVLRFKSNEAAFEYACRFLGRSVSKGVVLPGLVLTSREFSNLAGAVELDIFDVSDVVQTEANGGQRALLRVASPNGGFIVVARTAGAYGPRLVSGDFVAWYATDFVPEVAKAGVVDEQCGWIGMIVSTLRCEYGNGAWHGDRKFSVSKN